MFRSCWCKSRFQNTIWIWRKPGNHDQSTTLCPFRWYFKGHWYMWVVYIFVCKKNVDNLKYRILNYYINFKFLLSTENDIYLFYFRLLCKNNSNVPVGQLWLKCVQVSWYSFASSDFVHQDFYLFVKHTVFTRQKFIWSSKYYTKKYGCKVNVLNDYIYWWICSVSNVKEKFCFQISISNSLQFV